MIIFVLCPHQDVIAASRSSCPLSRKAVPAGTTSLPHMLHWAQVVPPTSISVNCCQIWSFFTSISKHLLKNRINMCLKHVFFVNGFHVFSFLPTLVFSKCNIRRRRNINIPPDTLWTGDSGKPVSSLKS